MQLFQSGDRVRVIANKSRHGVPTGTELTVENTNKRGSTIDGYWNEVHMVENEFWFYDTDIALIRPPNKKRGKYIITDPLFLMNNNQYQEIKENHEKYKEPDFEHLQFPISSTHEQTKEPIIFHYIETTPYGPGECEYNNQSIVNNSGMLCIAENPKEWSYELTGAKFETLQEAQDRFQDILKKL